MEVRVAGSRRIHGTLVARHQSPAAWDGVADCNLTDALSRDMSRCSVDESVDPRRKEMPIETEPSREVKEERKERNHGEL